MTLVDLFHFYSLRLQSPLISNSCLPRQAVAAAAAPAAAPAAPAPAAAAPAGTFTDIPISNVRKVSAWTQRSAPPLPSSSVRAEEGRPPPSSASWWQ